MTSILEIGAMADVEASVGTMLGPTAGLIVTQPMIDQFAEVTGDHQWIHTDPARAVEGPYGTTVAHGYLTLSLLPHFLDLLIERDAHVTSINYGLDTVRFPAAVPVDATLSMTATVVDCEDRGGGRARLRIECTLHLQGQRRPACVATAVLLYDGLR